VSPIELSKEKSESLCLLDITIIMDEANVRRRVLGNGNIPNRGEYDYVLGVCMFDLK